tara:strand:- start:43 stop:249 length:207 start_codon:yes stop_codon:yes gene_type:complete
VVVAEESIMVLQQLDLLDLVVEERELQEDHRQLIELVELVELTLVAVVVEDHIMDQAQLELAVQVVQV